MRKVWYKSPLTWGCMALCAALLVLGLLMEGRAGALRAEETVRVQVLEDCGAYVLEFAAGLSGASSGGVMNADGSPLTKGETYGWEAGEGLTVVKVTALDARRQVLHEITVTCDLSQGPCTLFLTGAGFLEAA